MGIVLAVKKKGVICIAADSMTISGGSRKQTAGHVVNTDKIIKWGSSYIGTPSHPSWLLVLESYISHAKGKPSLKSKEEIFEELLKMHGVLRERVLFVILCG
ncbi:MAG: hypothetical protein LVR00_00190 [Rhabdochlamydiaceae bacterium]|jgi:hypothetical protein